MTNRCNLIWNDGRAIDITLKDGRPCEQETRAVLPYRYRKAFDRSREWRQIGGATFRNMVMRSGRIVTIYVFPHTSKESVQ